MSKEATSEQSLVREGAGYYKVFQKGYEPKEGFLGHQRGKRQSILLTRKWRIMLEREVRKRR